MSDLTDDEIRDTIKLSDELERKNQIAYVPAHTLDLAGVAHAACRELQRRRLAYRCTVGSNECAIRRQCTNKCGRMTFIRDAVHK